VAPLVALPGAHVSDAVRPSYIDAHLIANIKTPTNTRQFDHAKLLRLVDELNDNYSRGNAYAAHALLRALLDHIPPMLGCADFRVVANNYHWNRTDKSYMRKLLDFKLQADDAGSAKLAGVKVSSGFSGGGAAGA
jgi:hypothetical protein